MAVSPQHFTQIDGLRVQFRVRGAGPPLLLLHGWGGSSLSFAAVIPALEQRFRLLIPDLPGFGFSEPPAAAWGSADYARVVAGLIESASAKPLDVLGHSFGGKVAVALATQYPELVRRLVLVAAPVVRLEQNAAVLSRGRAYRAVRAAARLLPPLREQILDWGRRRFGSEDYKAAGPLRPTLVRVVNEDWRPALPALRAPVLLIYGERDEDVPAAVGEAARDALPNAELVVMSGAGHFPFLDDAEGFSEAVAAFLARPAGVSGRGIAP
jgi:pimeloyl-ACP methyl ester carboxylesterase